MPFLLSFGFILTSLVIENKSSISITTAANQNAGFGFNHFNNEYVSTREIGGWPKNAAPEEVIKLNQAVD